MYIQNTHTYTYTYLQIAMFLLVPGGSQVLKFSKGRKMAGKLAPWLPSSWTWKSTWMSRDGS